MDEVAIRTAGEDDVEPLSRLGLQTFRETFLEGFAIPYPAQDLAVFEEAHYTAAAFARKLADPRQRIWLAERDGDLLAYASAGPCGLPHAEARPEHMELHRLYVLRGGQGLGIGRRLLDMALAWMETQGAGPRWLGVWSGNLKAQKLYEAYGFRKVGGYQFPVGAWRDDEFIYRREAIPRA